MHTAADAHAGCTLPKLVALDLSANALKELPSGFGAGLPALRRLHLACNRLQGLPASLGEVGGPARHAASRGNCKLPSAPVCDPNRAPTRVPTALPQTRSACPRRSPARLSVAPPRPQAPLTDLFANENPLGAFPSVLASCTRLRRLGLAACGLKGPLPPGAGAMASLRFLDLSLNELTGLPPELAACSLLAGLNLGFNPLGADLPPAVCGLGGLVELNVDCTGARARARWGPIAQGSQPTEYLLMSTSARALAYNRWVDAALASTI